MEEDRAIMEEINREESVMEKKEELTRRLVTGGRKTIECNSRDPS